MGWAEPRSVPAPCSAAASARPTQTLSRLLNASCPCTRPLRILHHHLGRGMATLKLRPRMERRAAATKVTCPAARAWSGRVGSGWVGWGLVGHDCSARLGRDCSGRKSLGRVGRLDPLVHGVAALWLERSSAPLLVHPPMTRRARGGQVSWIRTAHAPATPFEHTPTHHSCASHPHCPTQRHPPQGQGEAPYNTSPGLQPRQFERRRRR